jgi:hypothetical protein
MAKPKKLKRSPHTEHYKLELENARLTVWIKFRAKDGVDAAKRFNEMSERTLRQKVKEGQPSIRMLDIGNACVVDSFDPDDAGPIPRKDMAAYERAMAGSNGRKKK